MSTGARKAMRHGPAGALRRILSCLQYARNLAAAKESVVILLCVRVGRSQSGRAVAMTVLGLRLVAVIVWLAAGASGEGLSTM
ncbi:unnamed protein product [Timema podura]|uniref:Uncharacterized protein n=1 Tax=Timema podura TaxID=61482 RepID=A0ABN7P4P4_TIMPD|nr:unnamed protein product [Timema podura]